MPGTPPPPAPSSPCRTVRRRRRRSTNSTPYSTRSGCRGTRTGLGQLVARPKVNDTFHADRFDAGADGTPWPDRPATYFAWFACSPGGPPGPYPGADHAAYAIDTPGVDSFGFDESDRWVINHVKVTDPTGPGFDADDPVSIARYDRKSLQASWLAANDAVAGDVLALRAYATVEARPVHTGVRLPGFHPGPAAVEYLDPVSVVHRNTDDGLEVAGDGWLRSYTETVRPLGCDTDWSMSFLVDVHTTAARDTALLPVEDLALFSVTDTAAEFSWTNPAQTIEPTHTQIRLINPASLWSTVEYPLTGLTWSGLAPATGYEFQVRLVRIVDGFTTHFSPIRELPFTTLEATAPYVDPDGDVTSAARRPRLCRRLGVAILTRRRRPVDDGRRRHRHHRPVRDCRLRLFACWTRICCIGSRRSRCATGCRARRSPATCSRSAVRAPTGSKPRRTTKTSSPTGPRCAPAT